MYKYYLVLITNRVCFKVKWPIQNVATIPEVIVEEVKLSARDFQQDQNAERKLDNDQDNAAAETISQKKIIVNSDQKLVGENITENSSVKEFLVTENVTKSSSETEVKELPLTN